MCSLRCGGEHTRTRVSLYTGMFVHASYVKGKQDAGREDRRLPRGVDTQSGNKEAQGRDSASASVSKRWGLSEKREATVETDTEVFQFFAEEESCDSGTEKFGHAGRRCMRSVSCPEGVVNIHVSEAGQSTCQLFVVLRLSLFKSD